MKKIGLFAFVFIFLGMISITSCKQQVKESETTETVAPVEEETAPAEEVVEEVADTVQ